MRRGFVGAAAGARQSRAAAVGAGLACHGEARRGVPGAHRRFARARESPRPGRQPEDDHRPDVARAQATRPIVAVSLMSATSAFSSRSASFLNRTQDLPMLAFGSRSTYRSAT
jgi:hypothetical protein